MSLFNFEKKRISNTSKEKNFEPVDLKIIKEQDMEFGSLSLEDILKQKELLLKLTKSSSSESMAKVAKESEEDKNKEIEKLKESIGI